MDEETSRQKMLAQVERARQSAMAKQFDWGFEVDGLTLFIMLKRNAEPDRLYVLCARFDDFDRRAPSYNFVNPKSKAGDPSACPPNVMHSDGKICTPGTREFHEDLHKNDAEHAWDPNKHTVLGTIRMIHRMMNQ